jgi:hypothetical protein
MPVDRHGRRFIATAEAGHALHLNFWVYRFPAFAIESGAKLGGAAKMAGHILANTHVHFGWRCEVKMGIKACNTVQTVERKVNFGGEILQLVGRQVAELTLNLPQFVKDQRLASSTGEYSFASMKTTGSAMSVAFLT